LVKTHSLKHLGSAIALQRADAHLREGLQQALVDGLDEILLGILRADVVRQKSAALQVVQGLNREIGIDCARAVTDQQRKVHHLARFAAFNNQCYLGAGLLAHQAIVHGGHSQQTGNRCVGRIDSTVGEDQQRVARMDCMGRACA